MNTAPFYTKKLWNGQTVWQATGVDGQDIVGGAYLVNQSQRLVYFPPSASASASATVPKDPVDEWQLPPWQVKRDLRRAKREERLKLPDWLGTEKLQNV